MTKGLSDQYCNEETHWHSCPFFIISQPSKLFYTIIRDMFNKIKIHKYILLIFYIKILFSKLHKFLDFSPQNNNV